MHECLIIKTQRFNQIMTVNAITDVTFHTMPLIDITQNSMYLLLISSESLIVLSCQYTKLKHNIE